MAVRETESRIRVRYAETDQMGVVYHANYLVWMEVGRVELYRANGLRYRDMETEDGVVLAVGEVKCRFRTPARYDDEIKVRTRVAQAHPRLVVFRYEILNAETGALLATGETKHLFCKRDMTPTRLPVKYWQMFGIEDAAGEAAQVGTPLFVYGTLQRGFPNRWADELWKGIEQPTSARVKGRLYRVASYVGMRPAAEEGEWVYGQLVEPRDLLARLDEYEGKEYERTLCEAEVEGGEVVRVWAYRYRGEPAEDRRIPSGRFT